MNKPLVLVVEDDTPVRNLITTTLKTHEYRYLSAQNGASAVMEALSHNPDIVLLDLGLPDMDGVEIIQKIRSWSNMPIIVISARTEDSDKIGALDAGADDYLTKPFSVDELLARLRVTQRRLALIKADTAQETPIFTNGALKIDYAAGCAYLDGAELHLTPIEYCFSARIHGNPAQKAGKRERWAAIHTNAHRHRLSDAAGRVSNPCVRPLRTAFATSMGYIFANGIYFFSFHFRLSSFPWCIKARAMLCPSSSPSYQSGIRCIHTMTIV